MTDLDRSLSVYTTVFGFKCHASRPEERFAYLVRGNVHLMLEEAAGPSRRFTTASLEYPFGRGINLQIEVPDIGALYARVRQSGLILHIPLEERWYRQNDIEVGQRQFVVADPDGYLLRFFGSLGRRPTERTPASAATSSAPLGANPRPDISRLGPALAAEYRAIRLAALESEPEAFGSTFVAEAARPLGDFAARLTTSVVFGAYAGTRIVGVAGFQRNDGEKESHKGFVWGFYVHADHRGRGVGGALLDAIVTAARETVEQLTLTVVAANSPAIALYLARGFEIYGVEPRALRGPGGYADEILMALMLRPD